MKLEVSGFKLFCLAAWLQNTFLRRGTDQNTFVRAQGSTQVDIKAFSRYQNEET